MKLLSLGVLPTLLLSSIGFGQLKQGAWGIKTELGGSPSLGIAYCIQQNLRIGIDLGFTSSKTPADTSTTFSVGITPWYYFGMVENVSAFAGGMIAFSSKSNGSSQSGFELAGHFGAEYWFSQKFAWNAYLALGFTSYSGTGGSQFGTSTSTGLTWFF